jgi:2-(1,2-epoxy-1,2-dihydrophenyl)acetyl-CoA isomerase
MSTVLLVGAGDGVTTLTLNRPDAYNAIDPELRKALLSGLEEAQADQTRCIVLRGAGRGFCAGIDLKSGSGGITGHELMSYMQASTQALVRAILRPICSPGSSAPARAKRMLFFGDELPAREALAAGMIGEVVPAEVLDAAVAGRVARLAALPSATLHYTKSMLLRSFELDLESALFEERAGQALMSTTPDYAEGVAVFLERRPPNVG